MQHTSVWARPSTRVELTRRVWNCSTATSAWEPCPVHPAPTQVVVPLVPVARVLLPSAAQTPRVGSEGEGPMGMGADQCSNLLRGRAAHPEEPRACKKPFHTPLSSLPKLQNRRDGCKAYSPPHAESRR